MKTRSEQASSVRRTSQGKSGSSFQQKRAPSFMRGWKICRSGFPVCGGNWQKTRRTLPEMDDLLHVMLSDRSDVPGLSSLSPAPCWPGRCRSWALPDVRCRNCALPELGAPGCALPDVRCRIGAGASPRQTHVAISKPSGRLIGVTASTMLNNPAHLVGIFTCTDPNN